MAEETTSSSAVVADTNKSDTYKVTDEQRAEVTAASSKLSAEIASITSSKQGAPTNENNSSTANKPNANVEFEPPMACIRRLLKQVLPKSTNVSKDSLATISRASGIFVLYLTACANDVAREGRRTTIVAKDVMGALKELEFEEFVPLMEKFLESHRKEEKNKKEEKERIKKARESQDSSSGLAAATATANNKESGEAAADGEKKISGDSTADAGGDKVDGTEQKKETAVGDTKTAEGTAVAPTEEEKTEADTNVADAVSDKPDSAEGSSEAAAAVEGEVKHAREEVGDGDKSADEPSAKKQKVVV